MKLITRRIKRGVEVSAPVETHVPFSLLTLDLPPAPLFKDEQEKNIIPQVDLQIFACCSSERLVSTLFTGPPRDSAAQI